ncbi:MlaD family protein [Pseudomonas sp.]|uniref:MlaD family protein n=1 Tax=Pseudomonas sp. TaxID=306 RepID=UPI001A0A909A|nr:MlaD family protein [Pseudomonas sp.]MBF0676201.1 MCE family protein [Pseudomonas sp.]
METRAHHVLIGLFTVLVVAVGLLFALWLGKTSTDEAYNEYEVVFQEAVTGLSKGSAVEYSGIRIGDVMALWLDPLDPRKVRARIRVASTAPIKEDTRARLAITGITGTAIIQLHGGSPQSLPLQTNADDLAVIVADPSPISKLMEGGEDLMTNITRLLDQANRMFSEANIDRIAQTLAHIEQTTGSVAGQREALGQTLEQLNATLQASTSLLQNANELIDSQGRTTLTHASQAMAALARSSQQIESLLADNRESMNAGLRGVAELGPTLDDLREAMGSLRAFTRQLEENPAGYLFNRDAIREFQP